MNAPRSDVPPDVPVLSDAMNAPVARRQLFGERLAGLLLIAAACLAMFAANSGLQHGYHDLLHFDLGLRLPRLGSLTVHAFIVDGLMAIFFLLIGLEVKREWYEGRLATADARRLPILAAIAGMAMPALIYLVAVRFDPTLMHGWAIPTATDIAFAIAVLAILGTHAPPSIKLLLVTIAIVDDIGAVAVIALAYTDSLDTVALGGAIVAVIAMATLSLMGVRRIWPYLLGFAVLWVLVLMSGIHATIAGVLTALAVPLGKGEEHSTLEHLEHKIHPWVMFAIVPLFGFASAGTELRGAIGFIAEPLPLAVMLGLFLGKQIGVFGAIRWASAAGICCRPEGASWPQIYGASILCGIGFTMSLFITVLAFPGEPAHVDAAKIGILAGSLMSGLMGWLVLRIASPIPFFDDDVEDAKKIFGSKHRH